MVNYRIQIQYDGTAYRGWQRQKTEPATIQGILEDCISEIAGRQIKINGAGRTDAGVHAEGQVADFRLPEELEISFLFEQLNEKLPEDIRVLQLRRAGNNFHSRYDARSKIYVYSVDTRERQGVFARRYTSHLPGWADIEAVRRAAELLTGTHDFRSFTVMKDEQKNMVRTIYDIQITEQNGILTFRYHGNGFLQQMVRIITGTLLEVGTGRREPDEMSWIIQQRNRMAAGVAAEAKGLCLQQVRYE